MYKIISHEENKTIVEIESYLNISNDFLSELRALNYSSTIIFLSKDHDASRLTHLRENISSDYFIQLGFVCEKSKLQVKRAEFKNSILKELQMSQTELENLVFDTYQDDFLQEWGVYLGKKLNEENIHYLKQYAKPENSIVLADGETNSPIGMSLVFAAKYCTGEELLQIGWIWIKKELEGQKRLIAHGLIGDWLKRQNADLFQAGIHIHNIRSQSFFRNMGFEPRCAHFILK